MSKTLLHKVAQMPQRPDITPEARDRLISRALDANIGVRRMQEALRMSIHMQVSKDIMRQAMFVRLYLALSVLYTQLTALFVPGTLVNNAVATMGPFAWWPVGILCAVALVALADIFVNDLLPARWALPTAYTQRHYLYIVLAIGLASIAAVLAKRDGGVAILRYVLDATVAACIAVNDLYVRHRK